MPKAVPAMIQLQDLLVDSGSSLNILNVALQTIPNIPQDDIGNYLGVCIYTYTHAAQDLFSVAADSLQMLGLQYWPLI